MEEDAIFRTATYGMVHVMMMIIVLVNTTLELNTPFNHHFPVVNINFAFYQL
jgi:hypothetical protein